MWEIARDIAFIALIVFHFHDFALRVFGYLYAPTIIGMHFPPILFTGSCLTALVILGAIRLFFDHDWRGRLQNKYLRWYLASFFVCCAVILLTSPTIGGFMKIRNILYPLILFGAGYFCGINFRRVQIGIAVTAIVNIVTVIVTWVFFLESYITLILLYDTAIPGVKSLFRGTYRQSAAMVPTGLLVHRVYFRTFFVLVWALFLKSALNDANSVRFRIWSAVLAVVSFLMIVGSFSRTAMLTALFISAVLLYLWWREGGAQKTSVAVRYTAISIILALVFTLGAIVYSLQQNVNLNLLDTETLFQTSTYGRVGNWIRVIDTIDARNGWLIGADFAEPEVSSTRNEEVWSEFLFVASDNLFLDLLFRGGLILLGGYLLFLFLAYQNIREAKLEPDLTLFIATLLIFGNLETGNALITIVMLIAGGRVGDYFWKQASERRRTAISPS